MTPLRPVEEVHEEAYHSLRTPPPFRFKEISSAIGKGEKKKR